MKTLFILFLPFLSFSQNPYLDSLYLEYQTLKAKDAVKQDSIAAKKKEIEELWEKIRIGQEAAIELKKTRDELNEMYKLKERYQFQIDSLQKENMRLEELKLKETNP